MIISLLVFCQQGFWSAVAVSIAAICCSALFFFFRNKNDILNSVFICFLSLLISSSVFLTKTVTDYQSALLVVSDEERTVSGVLYEYEKDYGKYYYTLSDVIVNGIEIDHKIRVSSEIYKNIDIDDIMTFPKATIYELGSSNGNQSAYKANGIYLGAYTNEDFSVIKTENHSINYYLEYIRQYISYSLGVNLNPSYAAIADAMLTGNQSELDDETILNFRYSGISHLFAVSGLHLTLWSSALGAFLNKIFKTQKYLSNIICIIFVLFFMALTGFSKSVVRAGIMLIIMLFGRIIKYQSEPINSLFVAITIILLINPFAVMSVSLQMSFLATLGILILANPVSEPIFKLKDKIRSTFLYKIVSTSYITVTVSVIASLFTMPVSALSFGYVSVAAPITNLLCMFPSQAIMILSGLNVMTVGVPFISKPLSLVITVLTRYIVIVTDKIASAENSVMDTTSPIIRTVLIAVILLMAFFIIIFRKNDNKLRHTLFISAAAVTAISVCTLSVQAATIKISVADVGNGTSVILKTNDSDVIIGCGGSSYKSYKLTNIADLKLSTEYDLLIVPRNNETESEYVYKLLKRYSFKNSIISNDEYPEYITELLPEKTVFTDSCTLKLDDNTTLIYINNDSFSGLRIESKSFTCTILFVAVSDFSSVPEQWKSGSLLITRQSLPDIDLSGFENIIISSDKQIIYDNNNIYTTRFSGQLDYRMYPLGTSTVTEETHDYK